MKRTLHEQFSWCTRVVQSACACNSGVFFCFICTLRSGVFFLESSVLFFVSLLPDGDATSWPCSLVDVRGVQFFGDWLVRVVHYWDPMHFVLSGKGGTQYEYGSETAHSESSAKALLKQSTTCLVPYEARSTILDSPCSTLLMPKM